MNSAHQKNYGAHVPGIDDWQIYRGSGIGKQAFSLFEIGPLKRSGAEWNAIKAPTQLSVGQMNVAPTSAETGEESLFLNLKSKAKMHGTTTGPFGEFAR
jgi:hypothetical protein